MKRTLIAIVLSFAWIVAPTIGLAASQFVRMSDNLQSLVSHVNNALNDGLGIVLGRAVPYLSSLNLRHRDVNGTYRVDVGNAHGDLIGRPLVWASHQTTPFLVNTNGTSAIKCQVSGCGGLKAGNGIMIAQSGPLEPQPAIRVAPVIAHTGSGTGTHTYKIIIIVGDPIGGMSAASPVSNTLFSMPPLGSFGVNDYVTFNTSTGTALAMEPVYLIYSSYDAGAYTFVTAVNQLSGGATNETADFGQRPPDGRGWPITISGTSFAGQRENFFSYVTSMPDSTHLILNDAPAISLTGARAQGDDTLAYDLTERIAEAAGGGTVLAGPYSYNLWRSQYSNGSTWSTSVASGINFYPARVPVDSSNMTFAGTSADQTKLIVRPDASAFGITFGFAVEKNRPWTQTYYPIKPVNQGNLWVTLTTAADTSHFNVGDNLWLFFGSFFSSICPPSRGTPGSNCHFAETNSITEINSTLRKDLPQVSGEQKILRRCSGQSFWSRRSQGDEREGPLNGNNFAAQNHDTRHDSRYGKPLLHGWYRDR